MAASARGETALPGWMKVVFGLGVVLALVIAIPATLGLRQERQAWDILRAVAAQISTDAGAAELYRAQPDLRPGGDQAAFLKELQAWRPAFGELPEEGRRARNGYRAHREPGGGWAAVQGRGGAWLGVAWQDASGRLRLALGPDRLSVRDQLRPRGPEGASR